MTRTEYRHAQHCAKWFVAWYRALTERRAVSLTIPTEYRQMPLL